MIDYSTLPAREIERLSRHIGSGEWAIESRRPIATLLGSCVAVCLIDTGLPLAGMNHFMLPQMNKTADSGGNALLAGDVCMAALLDAMLRQGAARHRIKAKVFGGGTMIDTGSPDALTIGRRNVDFTRKWLDQQNIPLVMADFLGPWSRKVLLVPESGDAYCRRLIADQTSAAVQQHEALACAESWPQYPFGPAGQNIESCR